MESSLKEPNTLYVRGNVTDTMIILLRASADRFRLKKRQLTVFAQKASADRFRPKKRQLTVLKRTFID